MPRRTSPKLLALAAALVLAVAAVAQAAIGGGPTPPPKPLATAVHDALTAKPVDGVTARITFTNHLLSSASVPGVPSTPLVSGATGRLWAARDGRFRLELQSDRGDAQVVSDGRTLTLFDASANTLYRLALPRGTAGDAKGGDHADGPPSLADVQRALGRLAGQATVSGAVPSSIAGQPAYTLTVSPKHDAGLLGSAAVAWDAVRGVPLRLALTAQGSDQPVLELKADDISYGAVAAGDLAGPTPRGAKVVTVATPTAPAGADQHGGAADVQGLDAVRSRVGFTLAAPDTLVGLPRRQVRLLEGKGGRADAGAVVLYGQGLGTLAVIEQPATAAPPATPGSSARPGAEHAGLDAFPTVAIDGATGHELATALGTALQVERGGVRYTLVGSLPPTAAEAAARALR